MTANKIKKGSDTQAFLATTALEEFWDTSMCIIFLGEWCKRYSRRSFWKDLNSIIMKHPWKNNEDRMTACSYVNGVYEQYLPLLGNLLNQLHNVKHGERYWRIVIGPWLHWYISILYERYMTLLCALKTYSNLSTIGLSQESYIVPKNTLEFCELAKKDHYNLQIYTRISDLLHKEMIRERRVIKRADTLSKRKNTLVDKTKEYINMLRIAAWRMCQKKNSIILKDSYFTKRAKFQLYFKTNGMVWCYDDWKTPKLQEHPMDRRSRAVVSNVLPENNEFESVIKKLLSFDIPKSFIEDYEDIFEASNDRYPIDPKVIFSANAWSFDEPFKQWAARSAETGAVLLGTQHGGNYGSNYCHTAEEAELIAIDRYFTWGWERTDYVLKTIPFYATKFAGLKRIGADNRKKGALFVGTMSPRYFYVFAGYPDNFDDYLNCQLRFMNTLAPKILEDVRLRMHPEDNGWDRLERWKDFSANFDMDSCNMPFRKSLEKCKICIIDHLSTTFIEALSADKPTILFWDPVANKLRPEAEPFYDSLRDVGILYDTPEEAAFAASTHYYDVESWWNSPNLQAVREKFCYRFGRTSSDSIKQWANKLVQIAN